ncbi:conserved hypothetical protein [Deferribacter desulfuricans SSM1]|uniref:Methionyl-tRNA formyltransferase n=1 Tax=Deferribacter desulfuricans (strain DSM 14783 / JCM 11476 / NBRC 101012 / SSM1) TaxID=639282 RepID=D3PDC5_DEFDS|nr:formyltransferase family protein [Deferribacter desulfuricans]BAI80598.1 conserved hypothetical protein [Deferribacter desulfuricans SSM1]
MKLALFLDNFIGYRLLEILSNSGLKDLRVFTYHPNTKRTNQVYDFSKFARDFSITYLDGNKYSFVKNKIKNIDVALCIDWTKDFFINENTSFKILYAHPSLLPYYRGYGAISEQFFRGVVKSGLTIYEPIDKVDAGPILFQDVIKIEFDDYPVDFIEKYIEKVEIFIDNLLNNKVNFNNSIPQNDELGFYLVRKRKKDAIIDFNKSAYAVYNHIRAYSYPFFGAFAISKNEKVTIWKAHIEKWDGDYGYPGTVIKKTKNGIEVACGSGTIIVSKIELNSKLYNFEEIPLEENTILNHL